jgi:hypothetical protein
MLHNMKTCGGSGGIAPRIINLFTISRFYAPASSISEKYTSDRRPSGFLVTVWACEEKKHFCLCQESSAYFSAFQP